MPARRNRVTKGDDYRHIVRRGNRVSGALSITHAVFRISQDESDPCDDSQIHTGSTARFGFIISKAVGNAVTRNLVRRRMKTIVDRRMSAGFTDADVVFRALPASAGASFALLESEMNTALDRLEKRRNQMLNEDRVSG